MLGWSQQFSIFLFLDHNDYSVSPGRFECLLGVDPVHVISGATAEVLGQVFQWQKNANDWLLGHISYDYKNAIECRLSSRHQPQIGFPMLHFFCPAVVAYIGQDKTSLTIECTDSDPAAIYESIIDATIPEVKDMPALRFQQRIDRAQYLTTIETLRQHIKEGDCYEINFCNEGFCQDASIDPHAAFKALNKVSPAPFAAFYRLQDLYLMSASPERYLYKQGNRLLTQPIKGTARRDADSTTDLAIKEALRVSAKDRAENVMIVDLMRNDLARSCEVGSIKAEELFGIYSFPQVHHMISTITGTLRQDVPFTDAIRYSFPMGSMTGAPKIKVMELIDQYEGVRRELFSGTVGYVTPERDFDFNVVIRSLFYNTADRYLSYQTGGAITYDSDPQQEWEEMRLKAWALERIFS